MSDQLYVNADWSALVPAGSPDAAYGIQPKDAQRRGLLPADDEAPDEPETLTSANLLKEAEKPEDKAADTPADKSVRKPKTK